jgi:parallel beta-helix repeat protein
MVISRRTTLFLTFLFVSISAFAANRFVANGGIDAANNCTNSGTPCATIQHAVSVSSTGDTINVAAGTYSELVTVNKSVTLLGAQNGVDARTRVGAESILDGALNLGKSLLYVTASDVVIDGFTVQNATNVNVFGFGILLAPSTTGNQVLNNIVQNNIVGLGLAGSNVTIQKNLFKNNNQPGPANGQGVYTDQFVGGGPVSSVFIDSNAFTGNGVAGFDVSDTDLANPDTKFTFSNNSFDSNGRGILLFDTQSSSITNNTFTNTVPPTDGGRSAAIALDGGDVGIPIMNNTLQTGAAYGIRIINFLAASAPNSNIPINQNNITGFATAGLFIDTVNDPSNGEFQPAYSPTPDDATCDWWGSASGPRNPGNPGGTGDVVSGPATFSPWLFAPAPGPCSSTAALDRSFQVRYASNLINGGDAVINITNTGASSTALLPPGQIVGGVNQNNINGDICVNIYTFAADEQEVACCACMITPNALWSASVKTALLNRTLTPSFPNEVLIKLISTPPIVNQSTHTEGCNPAAIQVASGTPASLTAPGPLAWGTSLHGSPTGTGPNFQMTETPFVPATLTAAELTRDVQECQFIQILGSGQFGICRGCSNVGLGAAAQ